MVPPPNRSQASELAAPDHRLSTRMLDVEAIGVPDDQLHRRRLGSRDDEVSRLASAPAASSTMTCFRGGGLRWPDRGVADRRTDVDGLDMRITAKLAETRVGGHAGVADKRVTRPGKRIARRRARNRGSHDGGAVVEAPASPRPAMPSAIGFRRWRLSSAYNSVLMLRGSTPCRTDFTAGDPECAIDAPEHVGAFDGVERTIGDIRARAIRPKIAGRDVLAVTLARGCHDVGDKPPGECRRVSGVDQLGVEDLLDAGLEPRRRFVDQRVGQGPRVRRPG